MVTPLSTLPPSPPPPFLSYQPTPYHSSAVLAAAVDTCSLMYRIPDAGVGIQDLCAILTPSGRKLTALSAHIPFPLVGKSTLVNSLSLHPFSSASCLTPCVDQSSLSVAACHVVRGVPASYELFDSGSPHHTCYDSSTSLSDFLSHQFGGRYAGCTSFSFVASSPLSLRDPFPQVFTADITPLGLIHSVSREELAEAGASATVKSVSILIFL